MRNNVTKNRNRGKSNKKNCFLYQNIIISFI